MDDLAGYLFVGFLLVVFFLGGMALGYNIGYPDVVKLDGKNCILIYEQDVVRKFCEVKGE